MGIVDPNTNGAIFPSVNFNDKKITMVITSYNRWPQLEACLDSIMTLTKFPIERYIVVEDSANKEMAKKIIDKYGNKVDLLFNSKRIGQAPSIDRAYRTVNTKYILHSEDDYIFDTNPNFIQEAIEVLEEREDAHQIWVRQFEDFKKDQGYDQFEEKECRLVSTNVPYKWLKKSDWVGFSWNAHVKRTADYYKMFPEGYGKYMSPEAIDLVKPSGVQTEARCNDVAAAQGYRGILILNGAAKNMGISVPTYP